MGMLLTHVLDHQLTVFMMEGVRFCNYLDYQRKVKLVGTIGIE